VPWSVGNREEHRLGTSSGIWHALYETMWGGGGAHQPSRRKGRREPKRKRAVVKDDLAVREEKEKDGRLYAEKGVRELFGKAAGPRVLGVAAPMSVWGRAVFRRAGREEAGEGPQNTAIRSLGRLPRRVAKSVQKRGLQPREHLRVSTERSGTMIGWGRGDGPG